MLRRTATVAALLAFPAWGQEQPPIPEVPRSEAAAADVASIPGLENADFKVTPAPLRREGTFLVRQRGSMVKLKTGDWVFVFARDKAGTAERPMILIPSEHLARMERLAGDPPNDTVFVVTGQVFVYEGVNYFLPTVPPTIATAESPAPDGATPADLPSEPADRSDPEVEDLLRELEAQRAKPRSVGLPQAAEPGEGRASEQGLPDVITRRRGRIGRSPAGDAVFTMDNDADGSPGLDPPTLLVPCLLRERIERAARAKSDPGAFEVSGRVLHYEGRAYLIPTLYRLYPASDLQRRQ